MNPKEYLRNNNTYYTRLYLCNTHTYSIHLFALTKHKQLRQYNTINYVNNAQIIM